MHFRAPQHWPEVDLDTAKELLAAVNWKRDDFGYYDAVGWRKRIAFTDGHPQWRHWVDHEFFKPA